MSDTFSMDYTSCHADNNNNTNNTITPNTDLIEPQTYNHHLHPLYHHRDLQTPLLTSWNPTFTPITTAPTRAPFLRIIAVTTTTTTTTEAVVVAA